MMHARSSGSNGLPIWAVCTNSQCRHVFVADKVFGGNPGAGLIITGATTNCPVCGSIAKMEDVKSDENGFITYSGLANILGATKREQIQVLADKLNAANEVFDGASLANVLVEANPKFKGIGEFLRGLSAKEAREWIILLVMIITAYLGWETLQLSREQYANQKERDQEQSKVSASYEERISDLEKRFEQLRSNQESLRIKKKPAPETKNNRNDNFKLKGCDRNKFCSCGSGRKAKKCHPDGLPKLYHT